MSKRDEVLRHLPYAFHDQHGHWTQEATDAALWFLIEDSIVTTLIETLLGALSVEDVEELVASLEPEIAG